MSGLVRDSRKRPLRFELTVIPSQTDERFGIQLSETGDANGSKPLRVTLGEAATARVINSLMGALRESKQKPAALAAGRKQPIALSEAAGVRLALVALATQPVSRRVRVGEIEEGVASMSTEETYYWYSKCLGAEGSRACRALRLLLSNE